MGAGARTEGAAGGYFSSAGGVQPGEPLPKTGLSQYFQYLMSEGVVDLIDKAWKFGGDVFESFVIHQIDGLGLEGLHKALGLGIVIGIATSAHRADETMFGQQVAIRFGGVLRTTIRVMDAALRRLSYSDSRL